VVHGSLQHLLGIYVPELKVLGPHDALPNPHLVTEPLCHRPMEAAFPLGQPSWNQFGQQQIHGFQPRFGKPLALLDERGHGIGPGFSIGDFTQVLKIRAELVEPREVLGQAAGLQQIPQGRELDFGSSGK
jgi:hypothetical protein